MAKVLDTPTHPLTAIFRRIILQLRNDTRFVCAIVGVANLRSWTGMQDDYVELRAKKGGAVVRLTPQPREVDWYSEEAQAGMLAVKVEMSVGSLCIDDITDLWGVIVHALLPGGPSTLHAAQQPDEFAGDLKSLGAETGEIVFALPAVDLQPEGNIQGWMYGIGMFRLRVKQSILS